MSRASRYVGRFAPSPTGPLHFGSLLAAAASYLEARRHLGRWLVRIEDIDPPREQAGAADDIVLALGAYGFSSAEGVAWQSRSALDHARALTELLENGHAYYCDCSRKDLADADQSVLGPVYPGTCRDRCLAPGPDLSIRVRTDGAHVVFPDRLQGRQEQQLEALSGDFIIRRRDGLIAYQLAVVVDDHLQGITEVVRGIDLMNSTPRQVWLQQLLGYSTPAYAHIPVAVDATGTKLSKAAQAPALPVHAPGPVLVRALTTLQMAPPATLRDAPIESIWDWAAGEWDIDRLRGMKSVNAT